MEYCESIETINSLNDESVPILCITEGENNNENIGYKRKRKEEEEEEEDLDLNIILGEEEIDNEYSLKPPLKKIKLFDSKLNITRIANQRINRSRSMKQRTNTQGINTQGTNTQGTSRPRTINQRINNQGTNRPRIINQRTNTQRINNQRINNQRANRPRIINQRINRPRISNQRINRPKNTVKFNGIQIVQYYACFKCKSFWSNCIDTNCVICNNCRTKYPILLFKALKIFNVCECSRCGSFWRIANLTKLQCICDNMKKGVKCGTLNTIHNIQSAHKTINILDKYIENQDGYLKEELLNHVLIQLKYVYRLN